MGQTHVRAEIVADHLHVAVLDETAVLVGDQPQEKEGLAHLQRRNRLQLAGEEGHLLGSECENGLERMTAGSGKGDSQGDVGAESGDRGKDQVQLAGVRHKFRIKTADSPFLQQELVLLRFLLQRFFCRTFPRALLLQCSYFLIKL